MRDFSVGGSTICLGGSDFSRVKRNFAIGQSPKICGNFSKICIKINFKKLKKLRKFEKNANFSENFLIVGRAINFYLCEKLRI